VTEAGRDASVTRVTAGLVAGWALLVDSLPQAA
jgi:hypothetical protein